jgi:hypothetical protein
MAGVLYGQNPHPAKPEASNFKGNPVLRIPFEKEGKVLVISKEDAKLICEYIEDIREFIDTKK